MTAEQDITYQDLQKFNQDYEQTPASASLGGGSGKRSDRSQPQLCSQMRFKPSIFN